MHGFSNNDAFKFGSFGDSLAKINIGIFGYLAYIYLPFLLFGLFRLYKDSAYSLRKMEITLSCILAFLSLLMLQAIIFKNGAFGIFIVNNLSFFIGIFGCFLLALCALIASFIILYKNSLHKIKYILNLIKFELRNIVRKINAQIIKIHNNALDKIRRKNISEAVVDFEISPDFEDVNEYTQLFKAQDSAKAKDLNEKKTIIDLSINHVQKEVQFGKYDKDYQKLNSECMQQNAPKKIDIMTKEEQFQAVIKYRQNMLKNSMNFNSENANDVINNKQDSSNNHFKEFNGENFRESSFNNFALNNGNAQEGIIKESNLKFFDNANITTEKNSDSNLHNAKIQKQNDNENTINNDIATTNLAHNNTLATYNENSNVKFDLAIEKTQNNMRNINEVQNSHADINHAESNTKTQSDNAQIEKTQNIDFKILENLNISKELASKIENIHNDYKNSNASVENKIINKSDILPENISANNDTQKLEKSNAQNMQNNNDEAQFFKNEAYDIDNDEAFFESKNVNDFTMQNIALNGENRTINHNIQSNKNATNQTNNQHLKFSQLQSNENEKYHLPPLDLLNKSNEMSSQIDEREIDSKIQNLLNKLAVFKISGDIVRVYSGPVVTTFEFRPEANVKVNKILSLQDDLAMTLRAKNIRIEAPIPGKDVMGIEIPNSQIQTIFLRDILESSAFINANSNLTIALGRDIVGNAFVSNLEKLPHLLVAGTTGSGKSVGVNAIILSLLYKNSPHTLKLMMIDPKKVEFEAYEDIPHLITPVINNPQKAVQALSAAALEMDRRYDKLASMKSKNIHSYNQKVDSENFMPFLVIIIDELADLIMTGGKDVEFSIARIAQMGRACGMHLIVATQRSSTDVVTGLIKTNLPSRISYKVGNRIDSKVILDQFGAERLLGNGDGLFTPPGGGLVRIHAPWVSESEIENIVNFIKAQMPVQYDDNFLSEKKATSSGIEKFGDDALLQEAKDIILQDNRTSISNLQRRLAIGYNKASLIVEALEAEGFLSAPNSKNERTILGN